MTGVQTCALPISVGLSRTPASIVRATGEMGEHTDEVLAEMGYSSDQIRALHERGAL